jgi:uncharacterized protein YggU (UPF0235/DUF167 family)
MTETPVLSALAAGLRLHVRLTPKSAGDGFGGLSTLSDGRTVFRMRVRAVPEKGAANAAMTKLLATELGLGKSKIRVVSGATSRLKTVEIAGDPVLLRRQLITLFDKTSNHDR